MNLTKEHIEKLVKSQPENDNLPMPDTSYVIHDVKEIQNRIKLYDQKKIDRHLSNEEFTNKLKNKYQKLQENFPSIFEKTLLGTLELKRLEFMLKMIGDIKNKKVTKHEASVVVGQELVDNIVKPKLPPVKK